MNQLLGPDGLPIKRPVPKAGEMARAQATASLTGVRQPWSVGSVVGMTPQRLAAVLAAAAQGDAHDYLVLAEEMEERDGHYACELGKRKLAVLGLDVVVEAASDSAADTAIAEAVRRDIVQDEAFEDLQAGLLDGLGKGYAAVETLWDTAGKTWKPRAYEHRDPRWFVYDRETGRELRLRDDADPAFGVPLKPYGYAVHEPKLKMGLPIRGGLARLVAWSFLFKNYSLKDWAAFCETYGQPLRLGKYDAASTPEDIDILYRAVAMIGSDCAGVIPKAMEIDFVQSTGGVGSGADLYRHFCEFLDKQVSKAVLGQAGTADMHKGGGYAQSKTLDGVRDDLRDADAKQLARTIRRDVIEPYVRFNFGPDAAVPGLRLEHPKAEDLALLSEALTPFIDRGLKVRSSEVLSRFNLAAPETGDEVLGAAPTKAEIPPGEAIKAPNRALHRSAPGGGGCGCPSCGSTRARNRADPEQADDIDQLVDDLTGGWAPAMDPLIEPVVRLAEAAGSYAEFEAGLVDAAGAMDASALARLLGPALFKARGLGAATDQPRTG